MTRKRSYVDRRYMEWLDEMDRRHDRAVKRIGFMPGVGDDTLHAPLASYDILDFIGSDAPSVSNDPLIDFVFADLTSRIVGSRWSDSWKVSPRQAHVLKWNTECWVLEKTRKAGDCGITENRTDPFTHDDSRMAKRRFEDSKTTIRGRGKGFEEWKSRGF
ncbi:hypothetical protein C8R42DRAFT_741805 [Lentinula raphanica]|nr:hypothetical protein C8R42DRAFT_741805 [Lentinula raphanica]